MAAAGFLSTRADPPPVHKAHLCTDGSFHDSLRKVDGNCAECGVCSALCEHFACDVCGLKMCDKFPLKNELLSNKEQVLTLLRWQESRPRATTNGIDRLSRLADLDILNAVSSFDGVTTDTFEALAARKQEPTVLAELASLQGQEDALIASHASAKLEADILQAVLQALTATAARDATAYGDVEAQYSVAVQAEVAAAAGVQMHALRAISARATTTAASTSATALTTPALAEQLLQLLARKGVSSKELEEAQSAHQKAVAGQLVSEQALHQHHEIMARKREELASIRAAAQASERKFYDKLAKALADTLRSGVDGVGLSVVASSADVNSDCGVSAVPALPAVEIIPSAPALSAAATDKLEAYLHQLLEATTLVRREIASRSPGGGINAHPNAPMLADLVDERESAAMQQTSEAALQCVEAVDLNSIERVSATCKLNIASSVLLLPGLKALATFSAYSTQRETIVRCGGITVMMEGLRTHLRLADVAATACRSLMFLARDESSRIVITEAGGMPLVLEVLRCHMMDATVVEMACGAVANLALNFVNHVVTAAACDIVLPLEALRTYMTNAAVVKRACGALLHLSAIRSNLASIRDNTCRAILQETCTHHACGTEARTALDKLIRRAQPLSFNYERYVAYMRDPGGLCADNYDY